MVISNWLTNVKKQIQIFFAAFIGGIIGSANRILANLVQIIIIKNYVFRPGQGTFILYNSFVFFLCGQGHPEKKNHYLEIS